jgi:hypothetical protein
MQTIHNGNARSSKAMKPAVKPKPPTLQSGKALVEKRAKLYELANDKRAEPDIT